MFRHHVFISYANADNQPVIKGQKGWITLFQVTLQVLLSERLGEEVRIWRDVTATWQGSDSFSEEILNAIRDAALFFCIVTPRYIRSKWCMRELQEFCRHAERTGGLVVDNRSRVFKVIKTPLADTERLPDVLQDILGYPFFVEGIQGELQLDPYFGESKRDFRAMIARLSKDAAHMIERLAAVQAEAGAQRLEDKQSLSNRQTSTLENSKVAEGPHPIAERLWEELREPALEGEREERDSEPSPEPLVGDDETTASEHIIRWRVRCRIWREPLAKEVDLPMAWVPSDTATQVGEFLLGVEPVSLRQWREVAGWSSRENTLNLATPARGDLDQPVTGISQEQALEFCRLLALHSGRYYELPGEEQWEHACRAGSTSPYSWGDAWSGHLARATANPWGLRRMHGAVWQWCRGGALRGGAANQPVGLRVCCLPFGTPYFHLEASKSQWRPLITHAACARALARPLSEAEFLQLEQALRRFRILGLLHLRLFLSLLADRLGDGAADPQHPLALETDPDGLRRLATPAATDPFTTAAFAWQERDWRRLADSARSPQELLAELGLVSGERQQAVLHAIDRAASAFPEPR